MQKPTSFPIQKTDQDWRKELTPEQFHILREQGTERPGSSVLNFEHRSGTYVCAACDHPLFDSKTKFESGCGWPSFFDPLSNAVGASMDTKYQMIRTEIHCSQCGGHLGHVFDDGPAPTGQRYCMNGVSLKFIPEKS